MSDKKFGDLKKLNMREAWSHEAHEFTPWLHDNIGALGEALGMTLHAKNTEVAIGDFSLDLLAEDDNERKVAIENQFHRTDHSHLGQLLTYAAGCDADVLVWVTEEVRDEHRAAVEWLNRKTDTETEFYLVKVEVLQIDDSPLACQFVPVVAPNKWQKEVHQQATKTPKTPEDIACGKYFHHFSNELEEKGFKFEPAWHYDSTRFRYFYSGVRRWAYAHDIRDGYACVYFYLHYARSSEAQKVFAELIARKKVIEEKWGCKLEWDEWDNYSIGVCRDATFADSEASLTETRKWAVEQMLKLAEAIPPAMLQEIADKLDAEESEE